MRDGLDQIGRLRALRVDNTGGQPGTCGWGGGRGERGAVGRMGGPRGWCRAGDGDDGFEGRRGHVGHDTALAGDAGTVNFAELSPGDCDELFAAPRGTVARRTPKPRRRRAL